MEPPELILPGIICFENICKPECYNKAEAKIADLFPNCVTALVKQQLSSSFVPRTNSFIIFNIELAIIETALILFAMRIE